MTVCVFIGPTLPRSHAEDFLDALFLPPAAQGDVLRAARHRPAAIGLVDGYFQSVPSVRHKELLWAMAEGIHVFGSASMGALRAAELHAFGMVGVGRVFEAYASGSLTDDDEVAVLHGPAAIGYPVLSDALVNIRATLTVAAAEDVISQETRYALIKLAKATFFADRSFRTLLAAARKNGIGRMEELNNLCGWLPTGQVDQKRLDAIEMLCTMKDFLSTSPAPKEVRYYLEPTPPFDRT